MRIKYIADDGTEFDSEIQCEYYEWKLNHPHLTDIRIFDENGDELKDIFSEDTYEYSEKIVVTSIEAVNDLQELADYTGFNCYSDITDIGEWVFDNHDHTFIKCLTGDKTMKLYNTLSIISGCNHIIIYDGCVEVFNGKMCEVSKTEWDEKMNQYMNNDIIRVNTIDGAITIAV